MIGKSSAGKSEVAKVFADLLGWGGVNIGAFYIQIAQILFANEDKPSRRALHDAVTAIHPHTFLRAAAREIMSDEPAVNDALRSAS